MFRIVDPGKYLSSSGSFYIISLKLQIQEKLTSFGCHVWSGSRDQVKGAKQNCIRYILIFAIHYPSMQVTYQCSRSGVRRVAPSCMTAYLVRLQLCFGQDAFLSAPATPSFPPPFRPLKQPLTFLRSNLGTASRIPSDDRRWT